MSIVRHKNPVQAGRPIISKVVEHGGIVYLCGILPDPVGDISAQTRQVLERVDEALRLAGDMLTHVACRHAPVRGA